MGMGTNHSTTDSTTQKMSPQLLLFFSMFFITAASDSPSLDLSRTALVEKAVSLQEGVIQPILLGSVVIFTVVGAIDWFLQLVTSVVDTRGSIHENTLSVLQEVFMFMVFNGIVKNFIGLAKPSENPILLELNARTNPYIDEPKKRRRRDIENVSDKVINAILKYSN